MCFLKNRLPQDLRGSEKSPKSTFANAFSLLGQIMRWIQYSFFIFALLLVGCSGEPTAETAILGTWVQETPTAMTSRGVQTTTADTVLRLKKNGETHLTRNLTITGRNLPEDGVALSIELRGLWDIANGELTQTQNTALIMPRTSDEISKNWANQLQKQSENGHSSKKTILLANKERLILQDVNSGTTDTYRRK